MRTCQKPVKQLGIPVIIVLIMTGILFPAQTFAQTFSSELKSIPFPENIKLINCQFLDYDNDGDMDLLFPSLLFENIGKPEKPSFAKGLANPFNLKDLGNATFVDIDGDGDLDVFGSSLKKMKMGIITWKFYKNNGTPSKHQYADPVPIESGLDESYMTVRFVDIDGDNDLDAVGITNKYLIFQENTGSNETPQFSASKSEPFGLPETSGVIINFADIDNDGDMDAFYYGSIILNNGNKEMPSFSDITPTEFGIDESMQYVQFVDIDGDGDLDAVGTVKYKLFYQENTLK